MKVSKISKGEDDMKYKVIGWTNYDNEKYPCFDGSNDEYAAAYSAVVDEIREKGYRFSGDYHQWGESGSPVLNDGTLFILSMRGWGALMSEAVEPDNSDSMAYMNWYMDCLPLHGEERRTVYPEARVDDSQIVDRSEIEVSVLPEDDRDYEEEYVSGIEQLRSLFAMNAELRADLNLDEDEEK